MSRKYFIAGNWKMNKTAAEAAALIGAIREKIGSQTKVDVAVCPPFTAIDAASKALAGSEIKLGAQNMHFEKSGAFTGEVAADMLKEFGCAYVILGHSERREYFKECNCLINKKVKAVLANGMKPILCVGEKLEEQRYMQEIVLLTDKWDVAEELARLKSHIAIFRSAGDSDESAGRKLDFIVQEMNREVNTLDSKVADAEIRWLAVDAKAALERIREQIQNLE